MKQIDSAILITALTKTADRLEKGAAYQWSHMGSCNCGHLAQTVTLKSREEIHRLAMQKAGDWHEKALDYCPKSGYTIDHIITALLDIGVSLSDIMHLERLSGPEILRRLPENRRNLRHNNRLDVILYMRTWADLLTQKCLDGNAISIVIGQNWRISRRG